MKLPGFLIVKDSLFDQKDGLHYTNTLAVVFLFQVLDLL